PSRSSSSSKQSSSISTHTLSLHDALPIYRAYKRTFFYFSSLSSSASSSSSIFSIVNPVNPYNSVNIGVKNAKNKNGRKVNGATPDRKSTRLNSSHVSISYAVFCLKTKTIH